MRKILLVSTLLAISLTACSRREDLPPTPIEEAAKAQVAVGVDRGGNTIYKHCIDGVSYLTFASKTIIMQRNKKDEQVTCTQPDKPRVP